MRTLWDYKTDPDTFKACDGVTFDSKSSTPADALIDSIMSQRRSDKKLQKAAKDSDWGEYVMSLAQYCLPWAILAVFSIIGL